MKQLFLKNFFHPAQMGKIQWTKNSPLVFYPWQPAVVTTSIHYETTIQQWGLFKDPFYDPKYAGYDHQSNRAYWWKTFQTTDNKTVLFSDLFPDTRQLSCDITSADLDNFRQCYVLSLFNPIKPHFRPVNCSKPILNSFFCQKLDDVQKYNGNKTTSNWTEYTITTRYGQFLCGDEQYISTLYICDGHKDCPDGSDEMNCSCHVNGRKINDNVYCSKNCSAGNMCTCPILFTHLKLDGCHSYFKYELHKISDPKNKQNEIKMMYSCTNSSIKINFALVNDLIFDCPFYDDEEEMHVQSLPAEKVSRCTDSNMYECYPGHSKCYTKDQHCIYNLTHEEGSLMYCRNGRHLQACEKKDLYSIQICLQWKVGLLDWRWWIKLCKLYLYKHV